MGLLGITPSTSTKKKVLIVEDEQLLSETLEIKFKKSGYDVFTAKNGQEGLQKTTELKPDIILLDLLMPIMDGKTMLHKLRELPELKSLPVIVLTNSADVENMKDTLMYDNASAFLIKSNVSTEEIVQRVRELIT